jgi:hypothetical protein
VFVVSLEAPAVPAVSGLAPFEIVAGQTDGVWVTLTGSGFVAGDTAVFAHLAVSALRTAYESPTAIRAFIPAPFVRTPGTLLLRAASISDVSAESPTLPFTVLGVVAADPRPPQVTALTPSVVPLARAESPLTQSVTITGEGFSLGTVSDARVAAQPLATTVISPTELRAQLPRDPWRERTLVVTAVIEQTTGGTQSTVKVIPRASIALIVPDRIMPSTFYEESATGAGRYLLRTTTDAARQAYAGTANGDTFKRNQQGFVIEVLDPSRPDLQDPNKAQVRLESRLGTAVIDEIPQVKMDDFAGTKLRSTSRGDQMVAVTGGVDDGRVDGHAWPGLPPAPGDPLPSVAARFGSRIDGQPDDPSIETRLGGTLRVTYTNREKGVPTSIDVPVGRPLSDRRRLPVHAYIVDGSGWTSAEVERILAPSAAGAVGGPTAADVWASAGVELELVAVEMIGDPTGTLKRPALANCVPASPVGSGPSLCQPSDEQRDLATARDPAGVAQDVMSVFFVAGLDTEASSGRAVAQRSPAIGTLGTATTDIHTVVPRDTVRPLSDFLGLAFVAKSAPRSNGNPPLEPTSRTVAHEIAHVVFSVDPNQQFGGARDRPPTGLDVLTAGPVPNTALWKRRFDGPQLRIIIDGGGAASPSRFIRR